MRTNEKTIIQLIPQCKSFYDMAGAPKYATAPCLNDSFSLLGW